MYAYKWDQFQFVFINSNSGSSQSDSHDDMLGNPSEWLTMTDPGRNIKTNTTMKK